MFVVISSPVALLFSPSNALANPSVTDTSSNHATLPMSEEHSSPSVSSSAATIPTIQAPLQIPRAFQSTDIVSSTGIYELTFITSTTGAIDKIEMVFPAGTGIGPAGVIEKIGIGGGVLTKAGTTLTYDVTTPVSIPAGTFIRLEISGVKNPGTSSTFTATMTTRDSGGVVLDGPSQTNVYTIKQIGTNDIADNSITFTKPNENFMIKVELQDDAEGNAAGWNPNGPVTKYTISTPIDIIGCGGALPCAFIDIFVQNEATGGVNPSCDVTHVNWLLDEFEVTCLNSPSSGDTLHYIVTTLPQP